MAKLIVTSRSLLATRQMLEAVKTTLPNAKISRTGFRGIISIEVEGDLLGLARKVSMECFTDIGRAVPVLAEVQSTVEEVKKAAAEVGAEHIRQGEKFCFRLYKRGSHKLERPTPELGYEIGKAIGEALEQKYGKRPSVNLRSPDVKVIAEVLGPTTCVGILRREWMLFFC